MTRHSAALRVVRWAQTDGQTGVANLTGNPATSCERARKVPNDTKPLHATERAQQYNNCKLKYKKIRIQNTGEQAVVLSPNTAIYSYVDWHAFSVKRRQVTYVKRNMEALSCSHSCSAKAISITHSECVCSLKYPACNAHVPYCNLWPAPALPNISTLSHSCRFGRLLLKIQVVPVLFE